MKKLRVIYIAIVLEFILILAACTPSSPEPALDLHAEMIAFSSTRKGNNLEIFVMNTDGNGVTRLTNDSATDGSPNWSPDGKRIVFHSKRSGEFNLYIINVDGSGLFRLTDSKFEDKDPCWSPDGEWIAFHSYRNGIAELFIIRPDGTGLDRIETEITSMSDNSFAPNWSKDATQLVFYSDADGDLDVYKIDLAVTDIIDERTFDWVGQNLIQLTNTPGDDMSPAFSPDGGKIAFQSERSGNYEIFSMDVDGENQNQLSDAGGGYAVRVSWSSDGLRLVFSIVAADMKTASLFTINRDGTDQQKLTHTNSVDAAPAWKP